jgi:hypothetical protein
MSSRHELTTSTYRPARDELDDAKPHVPPGKTVDGFLRACLRALRAEPERLLAVLAPYWPPEKPRGRPRKTPPVGDPE